MAERRDRSALLWMVFVAALAALVRVLYMVEVHGHPLQLVATADPGVYDVRALEILAGQWRPTEVFFHSSPLYPYLLAAIYGLFGHAYAAVRIIQSAVGVATALVLFSTARRLFGLAEGVLAGLLSGLYVAFIFFDSELLMITFVIFFVVAALRLLLSYMDRPTTWRAMAAGLLLGLAALGKPNILLFVPVALVWLWRLSAPDRAGGVSRGSGGGRTGRRPRLVVAAMVALALGAILPVVPATVSNYMVSGDFVLTTSNGGINFFIGNNEDADGTFLVEQSMRGDLYVGSKRAAELEVGRELSAAEVSSFWLRKGLAYAREHPLEELKLLGRKLLLFWNAYEVPNHYDMNFFKTFSPILRWDPFLFAWMVPLGFLGIYVSRRRWREFMPLYLFVVTYMVSLLPFFITSRYRLPVVPIMLVFAAHGVKWTWSRLRSRERRGWLGPVVVLVCALVAVNLPLVDFTLGPSYAIVGAVYRDMGRLEEAVEQFRLATEASPGYDLAYSNMGSVLGRLGRYDEAERALEEALRLNPLLVVGHSNLGMIYVETGRVEEARREFTRALELDPLHKEAWIGLSRVGMMTGDYGLIERSLNKVLEVDPRDGEAHWNLAVLYADDPALAEQSAAHARAAATLNPRLRPEAERLLAFLTERDAQ